MSLLQKASIITTPTAYAEDYLYSIKPAYALGSELVTNGDFSTDSNWAEDGGAAAWSISGGKANCVVNASTRFLNQANALPAAGALKTYQVIYTISNYVQGALRISVGGYQSTPARLANGTYTEILQVTNPLSNKSIYLQANPNTIGSIDNLSVKEITDADFDFDRNSTGTRVNEDYLIEDVPYNLAKYSEDFTDSSFSKINATVTANQVLAPDGTLTADKIVFDGTANARVEQNLGTVINTNNTQSVFLKTESGTASVQIGSSSVDLSTITVTNEWKRFSFTGTGSFPRIKSDSAATIFAWGFQVVAGNEQKEYLKTTDRLDIPRIDYTNGEPSILLEPSRTNLVTYSQDLSQWTLVNGTLTANATVSPEGIQNSGKVAFSSVGLDLKRTITVVAGQTYTLSFYIKVEEGTGLFNGRFYDNSNTTNIEYYDYADQIIPNQWSRITRSVTAPSGCTEMQIWLLAGSSTLVTASFWGAQFEAGSYATSLIHTSGSTVTRSADAANNAGNSDLINSTEGVLYVEFKTPEPQPTAQYIAINDGAAGTNQVRIGWLNFKIYIQIRAGGSAFYTYNPSLPTHTEFNKIAVKFKASDHAVYINGQEVDTSTASNIFSSDVLNTLSFSAYTTTGKFYGNVKSVMVFKEALTDLELEKLTGYNNHELYMNYYNRLSYLGLAEEYNVESDINNYIL